MRSKNGDIHNRHWRKLRAQVLAEEPFCQIKGPGCTYTSTTVDHIIPRAHRPDLTMERSNLRGACKHCNYSAGATARKPQAPAKALSFFDTTPPPDALGA
ncbi:MULTISPECIES: HNH endonuclease signature motif containing protein [Mycobacteroides]|jgi:5-methylcytosine-specific restriction endonuclease McrA|uniref:HNH endonuclease signature motif containing protein n=1 Tax=Mycobacteroides TaxID=670516 RepID=UPI003204C557